MSDYLPDECLTEVLVRVPVKSLMRFRCVAKTWHSLISSPAFIATHLNHARHKASHGERSKLQDQIILFRHYSACEYADEDDHGYRTWITSDEEECFALHKDDESFPHSPTLNLKPPHNMWSGQYFPIVGLMNGIVCLVDWSRCIFWNPSLNTTMETSFRTGAGAFHWVAHTPPGQGSSSNVIVAFDMENEVFYEIALPSCLSSKPHLNMTVVLLNGSLVLVPDNEVYGDSYYSNSVWIMKEYGVVESWTKLFDIDIGEQGVRRVITFRNNGELLLNSDGKELLSYEPYTRETRDLHFKVRPSDGTSYETGSYFVDTHMESLVLLNEAHRPRLVGRIS
ncbi:F-box/kelch-repeat protein At3g06240-like isoform X3 [Argentina anserina]|uniref:F-box/kelch-repeat protein At3g06240-like isoform X3 n=1 Tax=Argentina anserina TaxID=57926 RepID=UPI0021764647|nr:F-box/kelch-repeat protein At3g06240-like isoform X3 [Potentilla anserina]